ncbi:MAG: hypothetical protein KGQ41_00815 [Alphaproteobacteria bacterium]|nr:hypothetical protein [Alphaproteobacteria bacterium]
MFFNSRAATVTKLLERHREIVGVQSANGIDAPTRQKLALELNNINSILDGYLQLVEIDPDHTKMLEQLVGNDTVHDKGTESVERLRELRTGRSDTQKTAIALVNPYTTSRVPEILAAIYVYKHTGAIASPKDLPGNIPHIIDQRMAAVSEAVSALIFYSICSMMLPGTKTHLLKGSGERLINMLFPFVGKRIMQGQLPENIWASTLSPFRSFCAAFPDLDFSKMTDEQIITLAVSHLETGRDPVERFHGGNGVMFGDVKLRANTPESNDGRGGAGAMINYVYDFDPAVRAERQALFKSKQFAALLAPHLAAYRNLVVPTASLRLRAG